MRSLPALLITSLLLCGCNPEPIAPVTVPDVEPLPTLPDWPNAATEALDTNKLMNIILQMESSGGVNCEARFEPGFLARYGNNPPMPELRRLFGDEAAASSYGCYQIMLCVAWENDFRYTPERLANTENNKVVAEFLIGKYEAECVDYPIRDQVWKIAKRYNGGDDYADKVTSLYFGDSK